MQTWPSKKVQGIWEENEIMGLGRNRPCPYFWYSVSVLFLDYCIIFNVENWNTFFRRGSFLELLDGLLYVFWMFNIRVDIFLCFGHFWFLVATRGWEQPNLGFWALLTFLTFLGSFGIWVWGCSHENIQIDWLLYEITQNYNKSATKLSISRIYLSS